VTTAIATEVQRRKPGRARGPRTPAGDLAARFDYIAATASEIQWPSTKYRDDPVAFCREVLAEQPWSKQVEIMNAIRDHKRVAVKSGHKIGKSRVAAAVALWFYCSFPAARVVMSSTTSRQVDQILWRELRMMYARSGTCAACWRASEIAERRAPRPCPHSAIIDDDMHELARSGLKASDFREIVGFTAREAEAVAGISGANLLYLLDEASGIDDAIFEAIEGNRAGGARVVMFSNPTRTEGEFFEAFNGKAQFYKCLTVSSEETPNVREGRDVVPGLAGREWVEEKKLEWGEDSPLYRVRVKGEFVLNEDGKILSVHAISQAEARWSDAPEIGRLHVGLDPSGPGLAGDESAFAVRRGAKVLRLYAFRGANEDALIAHLVGILKEHRRDRDPLPLVTIDREGPIGGAVFGRMRAYAELHPSEFEVAGVKASDRAMRAHQNYDRVRDELWANLADWVRDGGAIPEDTKLAKELHAPQWVGQLSGRLKVTPKDEIRKILGRSPDRADAVALSVWEPMSHRLPEQRGERADVVEHYDAPSEIDPYALDGVER
jgi:phage terminase large subunit